MFQCLGLSDVQQGGCGEDWWHPECLMGLPRAIPSEAIQKPDTKPANDGTDAETSAPEEGQEEPPLPPGFPQEDDFDHLICYKCVNANPWIKSYASATGFLPPVFLKSASNDGGETLADNNEPATESSQPTGAKRKAEDDDADTSSLVKKAKVEEEEEQAPPTVAERTYVELPDMKAKHATLPAPSTGTFSLFVKEDFRDHFCRCPDCFPKLAKHPQLLEEEESYEPPMSEDGADQINGGASVGSGSTYERGEALLSNVDRVRAIGEYPVPLLQQFVSS